MYYTVTVFLSPTSFMDSFKPSCLYDFSLVSLDFVTASCESAVSKLISNLSPTRCHMDLSGKHSKICYRYRFILTNVLLYVPTLWLGIARKWPLVVNQSSWDHIYVQNLHLALDQITFWCKCDNSWKSGSCYLTSHRLTVCCESCSSVITVFIPRLKPA